ncbi:MAG: DUF1573 domain-containing protein [Paraprevotella sp.]|nr:DUF1573 domain-containing protein [Paraprevotella sp.]
MRRTIIMVCVAVWTVATWAQPKLTVVHDVANLGEIMYQVPSTVVFKVCNTGDKDLVLTDVQPSCGCTTVDWTRNPIVAGSEGEIVVTYDAKMLGVFQKDIEVYSNASDKPTYLHFQGRVVTKVTDFTGAFPIDLGDVRLTQDNVEFDDLNIGDKPIIELQVLNVGRSAYKPRLMHLPSYLTAQYVPEVLAGGRIGKIILTLDSEKLNRMGLTQTSVYLSRKEGDRVSEENEIAISAVLLPDFSSLTTKERLLAPRMELSNEEVDMEPMGRKKKKTVDVYIKNSGQSPLNINTLQVFNKALSVSLSDKSIEPGRVARMKVTVRADFIEKEKSALRVLLISNDPHNPKRVITINVKP